MDLRTCLPEQLRTDSTVITRIAAGLSGAGVYRVDTGDRVFVLKVGRRHQPLAEWREKLQFQQLASAADLTPRIVHADAEHRAVLTEFVADRSFFGLYGPAQTRQAALVLLGRTLRRVHDLDVPPGVTSREPRDYLTDLSGLLAGFALPAFVSDAIERELHEPAPERDRAPVVSHNDANPSNLLYDGERLLLLDWDTAGINDPFYDMAVVSVFLRMDDAACLALISAHDDVAVATLPDRFVYNRRLARVMCGAIFLTLAHAGGHAGADGSETLEIAPSLAGVYERIRAGALNIATAAGQWDFGLALIGDSYTT
jgi:aminoglycoside phosphotransferase (APT) family kinase protein